jgi:hypothetical protein
MHIYVDESGSFVPSGTKAGVSLVGALVIPDGRMAKIFSKYVALRSRLPKHEGEVKGRLLNEDQVAEVVELLHRNEALLEIVAMDLNTHEPAEIEASKRDLAQSMTRGLTHAHHPSVLAGAANLAKRISELTHPLFVQSTVMFELIRHVSEVGINYHAQRHPQELAKFFWTFDGKDNQRTTNWEKLWADVLCRSCSQRPSPSQWDFSSSVTFSTSNASRPHHLTGFRGLSGVLTLRLTFGC